MLWMAGEGQQSISLTPLGFKCYMFKWIWKYDILDQAWLDLYFYWCLCFIPFLGFQTYSINPFPSFVPWESSLLAGPGWRSLAGRGRGSRHSNGYTALVCCGAAIHLPCVRSWSALCMRYSLELMCCGAAIRLPRVRSWSALCMRYSLEWKNQKQNKYITIIFLIFSNKSTCRK